MSKKRKFSSPLVDGPEQAPSRSMLRAAGFSDEDFNRPQVGVASTWSMVTPICTLTIWQLWFATQLTKRNSNQFFSIP